MRTRSEAERRPSLLPLRPLPFGVLLLLCASAPTPATAYIREQGRTLQRDSETEDRLDFTVRLSSGLIARDGCLRQSAAPASCLDRAAVVGQVIGTIGGQSLKITETKQHASLPVQLYRGELAGVPLCPTSTWAMALPLRYLPSGHVAALPDGQATLVCAASVLGGGGSVAAKCVEFGYSPFVSGRPAERHQVCTRMARADYCGIGRSDTVPGTTIGVYDGLALDAGAVSKRPMSGALPLEAAWRREDPVLNNKLGPAGALCLSKLRWATIPPHNNGGTLCGATALNPLPDPRDPKNLQNPAARFCEDYGDVASGAVYDALSRAGAWLYNDSRFLDRGLYSFRQSPEARDLDQRLAPAGCISDLAVTGTPGDSLTTARFYLGTPRGGAFCFETLGGPALEPGYRLLRFEGALYNPGVAPTDVPRPAGGNVPPLVMLRSYKNPRSGDRLTTSLDRACVEAAGYLYQADEGQLYAPDARCADLPAGGEPGTTTAVPLFSYYHAGRGDYLTTSEPPTEPGFTMLRREGFLPLRVVDDLAGGAPSLRSYANAGCRTDTAPPSPSCPLVPVSLAASTGGGCQAAPGALAGTTPGAAAGLALGLALAILWRRRDHRRVVLGQATAPPDATASALQ